MGIFWLFNQIKGFWNDITLYKHIQMYMLHTRGCMLEKVPAVAECDPSELLMHPVRLQVNASHRGRAVGEAEGGVFYQQVTGRDD